VTVLVLMDFSFDCVDYLLFLHKLVSLFDFHESGRDMVSTFLNGRSMVFDVDGTRSSSCALFSDVPQSSVPSPLFFLCLSIVCPNVFIFRNFIFMLMTCKLSGNRSDLDGLIARVTEDLETIHDWLIENVLLLFAQSY
jgi:hypothetical protein